MFAFDADNHWQKTDQVLVASDMWLVIRNFFWHQLPEGKRKFWTTDADPVYLWGPEPGIKIENAKPMKAEMGVFQLNMFVDYEALERERRLQGAMLEVRRKFGPNALFKGMNLLEGATTLERNRQIGGHKA